MMNIFNILPDVEQPDPQDEPVDVADASPNDQPEDQTQTAPDDQQMADQTGEWSLPIDHLGEYAEYLPKELAERKFANSEEAAEFYAQEFARSTQWVNSEDFLDKFLDKYSDKILEAEASSQDMLEFFKAFRKDPEAAVMAHVPQLAEKLGIVPEATDEDIEATIDEIISEEFGAQWKDVYNAADISRRTTVSGRIHRRIMELERNAEEYNAEARAARDRYLAEITNKQQPPQQGMDEEQMLDGLVDFYEEHLLDKGVSEEDFIAFIEANSGENAMLTPLDIWNARNYDRALEAARTEAMQEGRKALLEELRQAGVLKASSAELDRILSSDDDGKQTYGKYAWAMM